MKKKDTRKSAPNHDEEDTTEDQSDYENAIDDMLSEVVDSDEDE